MVEKRLEVIEQGDGLLLQMLNNFVKSLKPFKKGIVVPWVMILLYSFVVVLDDNTVIRDECFIQMHSDPWKLKYFDFSDFISSSRAEFIGRQWLYREMESELHQ